MDKSDFFKNVHDVARLIPCGRVTTYGAIARYLGATRSARMVGWAMNQSHLNDNIPAHRVVNKVGLLTGKFHFGSSDEMKRRLEREGVRVEDDAVVDFDRVFWDPSLELAL